MSKDTSRKKPTDQKSRILAALDDSESQNSHVDNIFAEHHTQIELGVGLNKQKTKSRIEKEQNVSPSQEGSLSQYQGKQKEEMVKAKKKTKYQTAQQGRKTRKQEFQSKEISVSYQHHQQTKDLHLVDDDQLQGSKVTFGEGGKEVSFWEKYQYQTGQKTFPINYPQSTLLFINNNNPQQNNMNNRRLPSLHKKRKSHLLPSSYHPQNNMQKIHTNYLSLSEKNQYQKTNSIKTHWMFPWIEIILCKTLHYHKGVEMYVFFVIFMMNFLVNRLVFQNNVQFLGDAVILLVMWIVSLAIRVGFEWLGFRKRLKVGVEYRDFEVYHHDGITPEWKITPIDSLQPGNIYKLPPNQTFPADSLLIHGSHSLLHTNSDPIKIKPTYLNLSQPVQLKQTIIKTDNIVLPISGMLEYITSKEQKVGQWLEGKLYLEQPIEIQHQVTSENVALRGSINDSGCEVLCMVLGVGIEGFGLQAMQYPYLFRKNLAGSRERNSVEKMVDYFMLVVLVVFCLFCGLGVLVGFLTGVMNQKHFYLGQTINPMTLLFYHLSSWIILIPIWTKPLLACYSYLIGRQLEKSFSSSHLITNEKNSSPHQQEEGLEFSQNENNFEIGRINIKDYSILQQIAHRDYVLSLNINFFQNTQPHKVKRFFVKNFPYIINQHNINKKNFSQEQLILLKYFMAVGLLSTLQEWENTRQNTYEEAILRTAKEEFGLKLERGKGKNRYLVVGPLEEVFGQSQLQVIHFLTLRESLNFPLTIAMFQIPQVVQQIDQKETKQDPKPEKKILCIIRGEPEFIIPKMVGQKNEIAFGQRLALTNQRYRKGEHMKKHQIDLQSHLYIGKQHQMLVSSEKLKKEENLNVQFIGKFTISIQQANILKEGYTSSATIASNIHKAIEKHFRKIEPMGLVAYESKFEQEQKDSQISKILNQKGQVNSLLFGKGQTISGSRQNQSGLTSENLPRMILINPIHESSCSHPQVQAMDVINNVLTNKKIFNFSQEQVGQKVLHDPVPLNEFIQKLQKQKIIVLNGWKNNDIRKVMRQLKDQKNEIVVVAVGKEEDLHLGKSCSYLLATSTQDSIIRSYADLEIQQKNNASKYLFFYALLQLFGAETHVIFKGKYLLFLGHIIKFVLYLTIETINIAYTLGTGISVIRYPLYLLTQIIMSLDLVFYFGLAFSQSQKQDSSRNKKKNDAPNLIFQISKNIAFCILGVFILIYTSVSPSGTYGNPTWSIFTVLHMHCLCIHIIVLSKLFWVKSIDSFKISIVIVQLLIYYLGQLIVSESSLYEFNGTVYYMFGSKDFLTVILLVWVYLGLEICQLVWEKEQRHIKRLLRGLKDNPNKYQNIKRLNKETNLEVLDL